MAVSRQSKRSAPPEPAPANRPPPIVLADHPALDFLNTRAFPGGTEVEWLTNGEDLLAWLAAMNLGDPAAREVPVDGGGARRLDAVASRARDLREWFRGFVERHAGKPLTPTAAGELGPLNKLLSEDCAFRRIEPLGRAEAGIDEAAKSLVWRRHRPKSPAGPALLLPTADAMGDLLTAEDFSLVRRCEGAGCSLIFLDRTKSHARRWCSMAWCGNRAKAAAHRARVRNPK